MRRKISSVALSLAPRSGERVGERGRILSALGAAALSLSLCLGLSTPALAQPMAGGGGRGMPDLRAISGRPLPDPGMPAGTVSVRVARKMPANGVADAEITAIIKNAGGDLRKLLIKRPKGTKVPDWEPGEDGWLNMADYADQLENSGREFGDLVKSEYRRAAGTSWLVGSNQSVEIRLVQYRQEESLGASDRVSWWNTDDTSSWPIPGAGDGMVYLFKVERKAGYLPLYKAQASASRGDIAMEIWIYDTKPIPKSKIMDLAKRQMERL